MDCSMPGFPVHHQLPENAQTHVHWVGDTIQPSHPLSSPSPPAFNLSQHQRSFPMSQFFPSGGQSFGSFSISLSNEYSGLISFRMDWLDLLVVQGTLKSLLQHHSSKASILQRSAFFAVQLSHPYMTTGKTIALTRQTFVGKVMSLLFNMLSRLVITFLPREDPKTWYKATVIKSVHTSRYTDIYTQLDRIEPPEIKHIYGHIFDKSAETVQWGRNSLSNKWCWENWTHAKEKNWTLLTLYANINSKWIKGLNITPKTIKFLKGKIGQIFMTLDLAMISLIWHQKQRQQNKK